MSTIITGSNVASSSVTATDITISSVTATDITIDGSPVFDPNDYTTLAEYTTRKYNGTITLSEPTTNFYYLYVEGCYHTGTLERLHSSRLVDSMIFGENYIFFSASGVYSIWNYTNSTTFTFTLEASSWIKKIIGIGRRV